MKTGDIQPNPNKTNPSPLQKKKKKNHFCRIIAVVADGGNNNNNKLILFFLAKKDEHFIFHFCFLEYIIIKITKELQKLERNPN